jgi:hypothetical protein
MIASASYRTDILAFYAGWFAQLLAMGHALVINPHGGKPYRVVLRGEGVDGFVPWTRNMEPFRENLNSLAAQGTAFMVQRMATGYPRPLEPSVVSAQQAVATITSLARQFGKRAVVWRYNPIAFTDLTDPDFYQNTSRCWPAPWPDSWMKPVSHSRRYIVKVGADHCMRLAVCGQPKIDDTACWRNINTTGATWRLRPPSARTEIFSLARA